MRTRVKICGVTRAEDAVIACRAGADAIGLVFYPPSPRNVSVASAREIVRELPAFVAAVGLFVNPDPELVARARGEVPLEVLQFHGDEPPERCARFGAPYIKAVRMRAGVDLLEYARRFEGARGLLLDSYVSGAQGGTGECFDWALIPEERPLPIVLSGGLNPHNVEQAIRTVRPWAVDVSSGVEAVKGIKDPARILAFMSGVRDADR